ncbi:MAG: carboxypeptidase regulatory-like domain-containing protein [Alphaproteobacteria bacterium]|nr:carboxypeptidase regulatory-like domain-containing protein [Alphaproteobacteria bacterium]
MSVPAYTQAVSSSIRGEIVSSDGTPVTNATVEIIDTRTNSVTRQGAPNGQFNASGLDVGGPYTIRVSAPGYQDTEITGVFITLGEPTRLAVNLESSQSATREKVTVTGTRGNAKIDARGTGTSFSERDIREAPVINNDFKEIISQSPLATHELAGAGSNVLLSTQQMSIASTNPRCNSFNIDGVSQNDSFGLNSGGYPTARAPLPTQWAKQIQVAVSPYDTEYNDFCGGVINVITKTGENEFHGGLYYNFKDQDLRGKDIGNGTSPTKVDFQEENWGAYLSGPIIEDKLFFFAGFNRILRTGATSDFGPAGSGAANVVGTVSQAELDQIINISKTIYAYDPGNTASSAPEDIKNRIVKLNYNINDNHRAQYTYQYSEGGANQAGSTPSFNSATGNPQRLALSSTRYFDGEELESHNFQFFSNWSDRFSTEVKLGRVFVIGNQIPLGGADMPTILVQADNASNPDSASYTGGDGYVILGPDNSRHFNFLEYTANVAKITATYDLDDHVIKAGYEKKTLDIFNSFVQTADAMYRFDCISDGVAGNGNCFDEGVVALFGDTRFGSNSATVPVNSVTYQNNPSNDPAAAAAKWGYNIDTLYAQDDWSITSNLAVLFGLRYDRFDSKGDIHANPGFAAAHGFDNTGDLDGLDIFLPRASFSYDLPPETEDGLDMTFRGGVGRYSGGAPNVWVSNNYSNDGMQQVLLSGLPGSGPLAGITPDFLNTTPGGGLTNLEQVHPALESLLSALTSNGTVNALAPDFKLPSIWRANLAMDVRWQDWDATIEYLRTDAVDQLFYQDLRMVPIDTGPDGRIIYDHITTVDPTKVRPTGVGDLVLRNADGGVGQFIMAGIGKRFDIDEGRGDVRLRLDYVHSDVEDLGGLTSSVAASNFTAQAKTAMNEPELGRSSYEREHIFKMRASAGYRFFDFLESRLSMFGVTMSGQGVSYTFQSNPYVDNINAASNPGGVNQTYNDNQPGGRALLYVPKTNASGEVVCGTTTATSSDPTVFFAAGFDCAGFNSYLRSQGLLDYAGGIAPRNFRDGPDITRIDLAFEQEVNFFGDHRAVLEFNIFNFTNLLNKKWGLWETPVFQNVQQVVNANYDRETDTYRFNSFQTGNGLQISTEASQWQAQVGIRYEF